MIYSKNLDTHYVRSNPGTRKAPNEKEANTRNSFGSLTWGFVNPIKPFLNLSYMEVAKGKRSLQAARSYLIKNALERDAKNNSTIIPSRMLMSRGSLALSDNIEVAFSDGNLNFTWSPQGAPRPSANDDQLMLMAYNVEAGEAATSLGAASRHQGHASLEVSSLPAGTMHVYLSFISLDRSRASDSVYLGEVNQ